MANVEKVRALVDKIEAEGTIQFRYIDKEDNGGYCYCAVGHALKMGGFDLEEVYKKNMAYEIAPFDLVMSINNIIDKVESHLDSYGLTNSQWDTLQSLNDNHDDPEERKEQVVAYLKYLM